MGGLETSTEPSHGDLDDSTNRDSIDDSALTRDYFCQVRLLSRAHCRTFTRRHLRYALTENYR
jgi:hypothetical protein